MEENKGPEVAKFLRIWEEKTVEEMEGTNKERRKNGAF